MSFVDQSKKERPTVAGGPLGIGWRRRSAAIVGLAFAGLGAANDELAAHEFLVVEFGYGALGFINGRHGHEAEALGLLIVFVRDDLGVFYRADAFEKLKEIAFRGIVAEVADVEFRRSDLDGLGFAHGPRIFAVRRCRVLLCAIRG